MTRRARVSPALQVSGKLVEQLSQGSVPLFACLGAGKISRCSHVGMLLPGRILGVEFASAILCRLEISASVSAELSGQQGQTSRAIPALRAGKIGRAVAVVFVVGANK